MIYKIVADYETGNSASKHDAREILDYGWTRLHIVKQNIIRLRSQWEWYKHEEKYPYRREEIEKPIYVDSEYGWSIYLLDNNGEEFKYSTLWIGFFETLYDLEIEGDFPKYRF